MDRAVDATAEVGENVAVEGEEAVFEAVYEGTRTSDLEGHSTTTEFTDEVIRRVRTKMAVWPTLNAE